MGANNFLLNNRRRVPGHHFQTGCVNTNVSHKNTSTNTKKKLHAIIEVRFSVTVRNSGGVVCPSVE